MTTHSEDLVSLEELRFVLSSYAGPNAPRKRPGRHGLRRVRPMLVTAVVVAALAVTGVAIADGSLFGIFGISNPGTPVTGGFYAVHALDVTGAKPGTLVELRASDGFAVYAARERKGRHFCLYFGQTGSNPNMGGSCLGIRGLRGAAFPSRSLPVWDMSSFGIVFRHGTPVVNAAVHFFIGVAANGVRSVQLLATSDCHVVVTAPVIDNVYMDVHPPLIAESHIVARNAAGKVVWHKQLEAGKKPLRSCGLR
jgi:hypothetical protein